MTFRDVINKLSQTFMSGIRGNVAENGNEVYVDVDSSIIKDVCLFLFKRADCQLVSLFANDEREISGALAVYYVFGCRSGGFFIILKTSLEEKTVSIDSISDVIPSASGYEREIHDLFGIIPLGHPGLRPLVFHGNWPEGHHPLLKDFHRNYKPPFSSKEQDFMRVEGEGVYQIPVGPVHAGIIEPGHFRFSVAGEPIINLEAQLYYVHKGIEKLSEGTSIEKCFYISERISGDETFANSLAYCQAVEKIAKVEIPERAAYSRVIFAELERLTSHLGDLAGICVDVAYGFAASQFRMLRGWAYNAADQLCGSRFLRSVNRLGGVRKDFVAGKEKLLAGLLDKINTELHDTVKIIKANGLFIDRVENTGILRREVAEDLNAVGPAGRAAGISYDVRKAFPYAAYGKLDFDVPEHQNGDVNCRMNVKIEECFQAIRLMLSSLEDMPEGEVFIPVTSVEPYRFAIGCTEAPRGENIHWVMTGEDNTIFRYKIRTPSFCNWPALCHAVKGNIVPDFPLINKSFNLSYAGNDL